MNPIDVLGVNPGGAISKRQDPRDYQWHPVEIAQAGVPFDWKHGYDVEADIASVLGHGFQLTLKDQGASGSCGGQAFGYYGQALRAFYEKDTVERSAKFLYSQVYVPGGGSGNRDLGAVITRQGFGRESDCVSYEMGQPPSELFMERSQDISGQARIHGLGPFVYSYAFPMLTIDIIAQAIKACKGVVLGIHGTNNGTWLSANPKPPHPGENTWAHWLYFGKAFLENGKKYVWGKQSWGPNIGIGGWQKLGEDYFNANAIWDAMTIVSTPVPTSLPTPHTFLVDLKQGAIGSDVFALQTYLAYDGCFTLTPTGTYGPITAQAVFRFQMKYHLASPAVLNELGGHTVGPATRNKLNNLFK